MRARRVTAVVALAVLASLLTVASARADDTPALTTPGSPTVLANEPHRLTLTWAPAAWAGEPTGDGPISYEVQVPLGPYTYRLLGTTTATTLTLTDLAPGTTYRIAVAARAPGGYSDSSPTTTVRTAAGRATVSYRNLDWSPTNNQIQYVLQVTNTGDGPLDLSTVRVRYHLRFEGGNTSLVTNCDWAALGCDTVRQTVLFFVPPTMPGTPTPPRYPIPGTTIPGWIELTFTGGALASGASTGPIQLRHHRHSWSDIDERDDPSWLAPAGQWTENDRVTLDVDGVPEFGDTF
ncbi:cellulose binding domain-containing protein [Micromonospora sp. MH99]|uniref:cellulose binding domain-containing protein n=1 Tax=Micromonospora sp. MH99 TaxID=1945510 RepID=UPI001F413A48|nr:cellulose binding domain-containing protein [Micromonospora sp. MH99]MCF0093101.1 Endoglucanase [Micromonospora sp. MH99]